MVGAGDEVRFSGELLLLQPLRRKNSPESIVPDKS
jgi:hypothetical protein